MHTPECQTALNVLYEKFSDNPTNTQKINILKKEMGDCNISYIGMSSDTSEQHDIVSIKVLEFEYLAREGLITPEYC